jgi:hypothetical protein
VYFQLATVAGSGIHVANAKRAPEERANPLVQYFAHAQLRIGRRGGFADNAERSDSP